MRGVLVVRVLSCLGLLLAMASAGACSGEGSSSDEPSVYGPPGSGGGGGSGAASSSGGDTGGSSSGGGSAFSGGSAGWSSDPTQCSNAECKAPDCCGDSCGSDSDCCRGTVCGQSGRCIPSECSSCGDLGCTVDFDACTAECRDPDCCGDSCNRDSNCCSGTICGNSGRCIPDSCSYCGDIGCTVDFDACTAECQVPDRCLDPCSSDSDCAAGTYCGSSTQSCFPNGCQGCGGMQPICRASEDCSYECVPPDSCGEPCTSDGECGSGSECHEFESGDKYCVPRGFHDACQACGSSCSFSTSDCEVTCGSTRTPDPPSTTERDAGSSDVDYGSDTPTTTACSACCEPCDNDSDCCSGNICGTKGQCVPSMCEFCENGCTFTCPS